MKNLVFTIISLLFFLLLTYLDISKYGSWGGYIFENICVLILGFIVVKTSEFCKSKSDGFIFSLSSSYEIILLLFEVVALVQFFCLCVSEIGSNKWRIIDVLYSIESSNSFVTGWFLLCLISSLKRVYKTKKIRDIFFVFPCKRGV